MICHWGLWAGLLVLAKARLEDDDPLNTPELQCLNSQSIFTDVPKCLGSEAQKQNVAEPIPMSWVRKDKCHALNGQDFCAFVQPGFQRGEGISFVTTDSRISEITSRPPFKQLHGHVLQETSQGIAASYAEAEIPGKGIGLIATQPIRARQRIMSRTPAVTVDGRALDGLDRPRMSELVALAIGGLPTQHRHRFLNLSTHASVDTYADKVHQIFSINRYRTWIGGSRWEFHSAFTEVSRLNHDCRPNAVYYFDSNALSQKVIAVRDIMPGEELTVSYIDGFQPQVARQELLLKYWGFSCSCQHCTAEKHIVEESDSRIKQVLQLWTELDDYSASSTATPEKAELLVLLYELEGMEGRLQEAYYRAAIEYNGIGQATRAMKYARLCLDRGLAFKGPGLPFIESMKELLRDPTMHKTWKSRLGQSG